MNSGQETFPLGLARKSSGIRPFKLKIRFQNKSSKHPREPAPFPGFQTIRQTRNLFRNERSFLHPPGRARRMKPRGNRETLPLRVAISPYNGIGVPRSLMLSAQFAYMAAAIPLSLQSKPRNFDTFFRVSSGNRDNSS